MTDNSDGDPNYQSNNELSAENAGSDATTSSPARELPSQFSRRQLQQTLTKRSEELLKS